MASDSEQVRTRFQADQAYSIYLGGDWYQLQVKVIRRGEIFFGSDWEARVIERLCRLKYDRRICGNNTEMQGTS